MARTSAPRRRAQLQIDLHVANGDRARALRIITRCPKPEHQSELHLRNRGLYAQPANVTASSASSTSTSSPARVAAFAAAPDAISATANTGTSNSLVRSSASARAFSPSSPASANREPKSSVSKTITASSDTSLL
ncbi:hypothetical protein C8F04DRAFT_1268716 [Mycena alexandri]|uniref:Uncharacterized protein n=1 Tax=Mycena alexandri TaxID=1745969 RepID=A0AAD6SDX4_9AGAR|nr:hypothetical protein C8F04DRAFT_1268716 [Mycena alexandri]